MKTKATKITTLLTLISFLLITQVSASNDVDIDTVRIYKGDIVNVLETRNISSWGTPIYTIVEGTLMFPVSGVYLNLPVGSNVLLKKGGEIAACEKSRFDANGIIIGGVMVWSKIEDHVIREVGYYQNFAINTAGKDDFSDDGELNNPNIENTNSPKLSPDSRDTYNKLYSLDELKEALYSK